MPPRVTPGGTANTALLVCWMYSFSASCVPAAAGSRRTALRVALEGDEEQPGVELAGHRVDAVGVGVAAAQDLDAAVRQRARRGGCGRRRDHRRAVAVLRARGRRCRARWLPGAARRSALTRPIVVLLVAERRRGPRSRSASGCGGRRGSCRRASTPAAPRRRPTRSGSIASASSASRLFVPSLKPMRLRGVACAARGRRRAPEAELRPAQHRRARGRCGARLRTAWKATCGSSAQAWTQRSPSVRVGLELVAGQRAERRAAPRGAATREAEAVVPSETEPARSRS